MAFMAHQPKTFIYIEFKFKMRLRLSLQPLNACMLMWLAGCMERCSCINRLLQSQCNEIILRRDVKFDENLLAYEPSSTIVSSSACEPYSAFVPSYDLADDDSEEENPPPPAHPPPDESFEPEPAPTPLLPRWVRSTREATGDLVGDPSDQCRTRSQFQQASSLLAQVLETHDPKTFVEASGHPDWDTTMNEEYRSLMENDTWDLVPLPKGRKLVRCKWVYRTKYASNGSVERHKGWLVAKGFSQVEGIDYNETFALVAIMNFIRLVLSLAASHNGRSIRWMLNLPSCTDICKKKSTWNNLLAMSKMTLVLFFASRNLFMVSSKLPELGMPKWIAFLLPLDSLDAILILMSIPRK
jgi:hypothetical protein